MEYIIISIIATILIFISILYFRSKKKNNETISKSNNVIKKQENIISDEIKTAQPEEIIYEDYKLEYEIEGEKIFEITPFEKSEILKFDNEFNKIEKNPKLKSSFNAIFSQIPMLGVNVANFNSLIVTFPPNVLKGISDGTYKLMQTKTGIIKSIAVNSSNGQIVKIGEVISKVNPVAAIAIVWQVAAMITAQKFLADINKKLEKIENSINELKEFLEIQQISTVIGNLDYLKKISTIIQSQILSDNEINTFHSQIEDIERDCLKVSNSIKPILERHTKSIEGFNFKPSGGTWFDNNTEEAHIDLSQKMENSNRYFNFYLIVLYVRLCNAKTLSCLPVNEQIYKSTIVNIDRDFKEIFEKRKTFSKFLSNNIPEFDAKYSREKTDIKYRKKLQKQLSQTNSNIQSREKAIINLNTEINKQFEFNKLTKSIDEKFYIELDDDNHIKTMKKIEKSALN